MQRREFIAGLGGAAVWPLAARAQPAAMPMIGYLSGAVEIADRPFIPSFHRGLAEQGYVEGRNVAIVYRWAETRFDQLPVLAAELVRLRAAVIYATGSAAAALAAKSATATTPIVFQFGADPIGLGIVASLNRPSGNVTGVTFLGEALVAKRLEVLHETVPTSTTIGLLVNPAAPQVEAEVREAEKAARALGVRLVILKATAPAEIEAAFAAIVEQRIGALQIAADTLFAGAQGAQIIALAARHAIPAIYYLREMVDGGGLMSYAASLFDTYRLAGNYAGRILNGEKPTDLPVQQSTKVEFVINMKAAKALGLAFPITLLGRADEVIE